MQAGQALTSLHGGEDHSTWPPLGRAWVPPPRSHREPAAFWRAGRCGECGETHRTLISLRALAPGQEVPVARNTGPGLPGPAGGLLVTFDGGAREVDGQRVAGAGAVLWSPPDLDGQRRRLA
eukprot:15475985-Alexandrium_andersonii.AAC.1